MSVTERLAPRYRAFLRHRSRDITTEIAGRSAVVLAPHPDDETLACGATIATKRASGARVRVVIVADGSGADRDPRTSIADYVELRRREAGEACRRLGVDDGDVTFLGLTDGSLDDAPGLVDALRDALLAEVPDDLFVPCAVDAHSDHRAVAAAAARLLPELPPSTAVYAYPVWFWNRWAWTRRETPRLLQHVELLTKPLWFAARSRPVAVHATVHLEAKRDALGEYRSQVTPGGDVAALDPEWLELVPRRHRTLLPGSPRDCRLVEPRLLEPAASARTDRHRGASSHRLISAASKASTEAGQLNLATVS